ncbi:OxaA-like protein precursor [Bacillus sp. SG-1]|nr:OxaA-like protein precursor [Bacillus sp. SG-1]
MFAQVPMIEKQMIGMIDGQARLSKIKRIREEAEGEKKIFSRAGFDWACNSLVRLHGI